MPRVNVEEGKILIIDDEEGNIRVLERLLRGANFVNIKSISDSRLAVETCYSFQPDLIMLDLKMPNIDGFEVMAELKKINTETYLPILVLTAQREHSTRLKALESGAKDFLTKPFELAEALTRVQIYDHNNNLETLVRERTQELEQTRLEIIHRLGRAAEFRDNETGRHVIRLSHMTERLAREIGMSEDDCKLLLHASPLHDVGKIGISDTILLKEGELTPEEWEAMKMHPVIGAEILSGSNSKMMKMAETICLTHQERWDGLGYPLGLKEEEIPLVGRIVAVCDVFDALTSKRPYKKAYSIDKAMDIIESKSGTDFEPRLVETFKKILPDMLDIVQEFADGEQEEMLKSFGSMTQ
jgi:putative two-component system response regulator